MSYARLLTRLYNTPLFLCESKLDAITQNVTLPLLAGLAVQSGTPSIDRPVPQGKAVVTIFDSLVSRNGVGDSGVTSYESIVNQTKAFVSAGHKTIYYYMASGGGEVDGMFGTAKFIASLPEKYGVETVGIVDGMMCSACYILGSAMGTLKATESSIIGSLGVMMTTIDVTAADKEKGIKYELLRSRSEKAVGNPHEGESPDSLKHKLEIVKALDRIMVENLSTFRPQVTAELVDKLNGKEVLAAEALSLGLIDEIVDSFEAAMSSTSHKPTTMSFKSNIGITMKTPEELLVANAQLTAEVTALKASADLSEAAGAKLEQTRMLGIMAAAQTLGVSMAVAQKRIVANATVADATDVFEAIAEATGSKTVLDVTPDTTINPTVLPEKEVAGFMASMEKEIQNPTEDLIGWGDL